MEEDEDFLLSAVYDKIIAFISFWYFSTAATEEDFKELENIFHKVSFLSKEKIKKMQFFQKVKIEKYSLIKYTEAVENASNYALMNPRFSLASQIIAYLLFILYK